MDIWYYLRLAGEIAAKKERHKKAYRLGAIAIRRDGALVQSTNGPTSTPNQDVHAEARVLRKAGVNATLFVSRISRDGSLRMAKPCPKCLAEIKNRKVKKVYYTISDNEYGVISLSTSLRQCC